MFYVNDDKKITRAYQDGSCFNRAESSEKIYLADVAEIGLADEDMSVSNLFNKSESKGDRKCGNRMIGRK